MSGVDLGYWRGRRVFVTGHMGFKGSWLCALLARLGAQTFGFGHDERDTLLYRELSLDRHTHQTGDINDLDALRTGLLESGAEILFHLAAQPLVLASYAAPIETFETNVVGTARVLEAVRSANSLKAAVVVTSDKVYRNTGLERGYHEDDPLGGSDPYSASKAAAEIVTRAMVLSYFDEAGSAQIATARAGNVIGGGDWAADRLLPDAARALSSGRDFVVRNPSSTRPWQHVLDPLAGYLLLAERLATKAAPTFDAWNFGPSSDAALTVGEVATLFAREWGNGAAWSLDTGRAPSGKEARLLAVDSTRSRRELPWHPRWSSQQAVARTARWYRDHAAGLDAQMLVNRDLSEFLSAF